MEVKVKASKSAKAIAACVAWLGMSGLGLAASFPDRPIEVLAPYGTASNSAIALQIIAEEVSKTLPKPMVVVPAPGGGGTVAADRVKRAKPDGYTLLLTNAATNAVSLHTKNVSYTNDDFEFLAEYGTFALGLVVAGDSPYKTVEDFVQFVRANPHKMKQASTGAGTTGHLALELFKIKGGGLKIDMVPFKTTFEMRTSVLGGHTQSAFLYGGGGGSNDEFSQMIASGGRLLAVTTAERLPAYPDVPTLKEKGIDAVFSSWYGIAGPKGMPPETSATLKKAIYDALEKPEVKTAIERLGFKFEFRRSEEFTRFVKAFEAQVKSIVQEAGIEAK